MHFFNKESQNSSRYLHFLLEQMDARLSRLLLDRRVGAKLPTNILDAIRRLLYTLKKRLLNGYNNSILYNSQIRSLFQDVMNGNGNVKITKRHIERVLQEFEGLLILLDGLDLGNFLEKKDLESICRLQVFLKNLSSSEILMTHETIIAF